MEYTPANIELENRRLQTLADFVEAYEAHGSREVMEAVKGEFIFPPIYPGISPDNDWHRFELWLNADATHKTIWEMLPEGIHFRKPEEISDDEIETELERLLKALQTIHIEVCLCDGLPIRVEYAYLYEMLDETEELGSGFTVDGCSGYCPDCVQRPCCETGQALCWKEDEEAGKIYWPESLTPFVSASPQSFALLQQAEEEKKAQSAKWMKEQGIEPETPPEPDDDWKAQWN